MPEHIVLGASGALGGAILKTLISQGKPVTAVVRDRKGRVPLTGEGFRLLEADLRDVQSIASVISPGAVLYFCVNVPYRLWEERMPAFLDAVLNASRGKGNTLVFPGNVYGYGPFQQVPAPEGHPKAAQTKKGRLRNAMEEKILEAHGRGVLSAVIPRFPDFFGPGVDNRLVGPIFRAAMAGKRVLWPGNPDVPHDFIFIGDAARAAILLGSEPKAHGKAWHVPGQGPLTGRQLVEEIARQAGKKPVLSVAGPGLLRLVALFDGEVREFLELLYQFQEPLLLDGQKFLKAFPHFRFTPHPEAIQETIRWFQKTP